MVYILTLPYASCDAILYIAYSEMKEAKGLVFFFFSSSYHDDSYYDYYRIHGMSTKTGFKYLIQVFLEDDECAPMKKIP
jgi:hypothetical protein